MNFKARSSLFAYAIVACALVSMYYFVHPFGCMVSPDSYSYLGGAVSLHHFNGFIGVDGTPISYWPPLYPLFLSLLGWLVPLTPQGAPVFLGYLIYLAILLLSWRILKENIFSPTIRLLTFICLAFSSTLLVYVGAVLSEGLFILWTILFIHLALRPFSAPAKLACLFAVATLATLTRYIGVILYPFAFILALLCLKAPSVSRRQWVLGITAACAACIPTGLWFIRNLLVAGGLTGPRGQDSGCDVIAYATSGLDVVTQFLLPGQLPFLLRLAFLAILLGVVVLLLRIHRQRTSLPGICLTWLLLYFLSLSALCSVAYMDPFDFRLMSPLFIPLIFLVAWVLDSIHDRSKVLGLLAIGCMSILVLFSLQRWTAKIRFAHNNGPGMYIGKTWSSDPFVQRCIAQPLEGIWYSNAHDALYLNTLQPFHPLPSASKAMPWFQSLQQQECSEFYLTWHTDFWRRYTITPEAIPSPWNLIELDSVGPWKIYKAQKSPEL